MAKVEETASSISWPAGCYCTACDCGGTHSKKLATECIGDDLKRYMSNHPEATCIVGINGGWYDLTSFRSKHPGGSAVLNWCHLQDASEPFKAFHGRNVLRGWKPIAYYRHPSDPAYHVFTELQETFQRERFFETSLHWYAAKFAFTFFFLFLAAFFLFILPMLGREATASLTKNSMPGYVNTAAQEHRVERGPWRADWPAAFFYDHMLSRYHLYRAVLGGISLGLFWQQCGFLMHDLMHNELTHNRRIDQPLGVLFGSILLGVSAHWWRDEHFEHHAFTNSVVTRKTTPPSDGASSRATALLPLHSVTRPVYVDPQMAEEVWAQNPKLFGLFFSTRPHSTALMSVFNTLKKYALRFCVTYQSFLWLPLCVIAGRPAIMLTGLLRERRWFEIAALFSHNVLMFHVMRHGFSTWALRVLFYASAALYEGILHVQLLISHYAKPWVELDDMFRSVGWYRSQVLCNMNIRNPVWLDWFHGGLNFHIEHHLFPLMPRHRLREASGRVRKACHELGIPYEEVGLFEGIYRTVIHLAHVTRVYRALSSPFGHNVGSSKPRNTNVRIAKPCTS